jgi:1,4-dihydroxy-2-naphthoate octaprenyltransferase
MTSLHLRLFIRLSFPVFLLSGLICYILGAGIVHYLGQPFDWGVFWIGLFWTFFLEAGGIYLNAYFMDRPFIDFPFHSPFRGARGVFGPEKLPRQVALWAAYVSLAFTASLTVLIFRFARPNPTTTLILVLLVVGVIIFTTPPFRQITLSYHELIISIWIGAFLPSAAYLLQVGQFHRLISMISFPLVAFHLAMVIVFSLEDFAQDIRYEIPSFLVRIGWQTGMNLHNFLVIAAYILILVAVVSGFPRAIALPLLITIPLGAFQIWNFLKISRGGKPYWRSLKISAVSLFIAVVYLTSYGFWTR